MKLLKNYVADRDRYARVYGYNADTIPSHAAVRVHSKTYRRLRRSPIPVYDPDRDTIEGRQVIVGDQTPPGRFFFTVPFWHPAREAGLIRFIGGPVNSMVCDLERWPAILVVEADGAAAKYELRTLVTSGRTVYRAYIYDGPADLRVTSRRAREHELEKPAPPRYTRNN